MSKWMIYVHFMHLTFDRRLVECPVRKLRIFTLRKAQFVSGKVGN